MALKSKHELLIADTIVLSGSDLSGLLDGVGNRIDTIPTTHNNLSGLNQGDYLHLTVEEYDGIISLSATVSGGLVDLQTYVDNNDAFLSASISGVSTYWTVQPTESIVGGSTNDITVGDYSFIGGGRNNQINNDYCSINGGWYADASVYGQQAYASGRFTAVGDAQTSRYVLRRSTTDENPVVLTTNNVAPAGDNQLILQNEQSVSFFGTVIAREENGSANAAWKVEGMLTTTNVPSATSLLGSTVTDISNVPTWTLALSADTTYGGLTVKFTGEAATNIRVVANIDTAEVIY